MSNTASNAFIRFFGLFVVSIMLPSLLPAQDAGGSIVGIVADPSGAVVPGVHISVTRLETNVSRETTTGANGFYQVLFLPIGNYTVSADRQGFDPIMISANTLGINQSLRVDIQLRVGKRTDSLVVESTPNLVETMNPTMGSTVASQTIHNMPLNGRNVLDLALLQPGVLPADNDGNEGAASATTAFSVSGGRNDSNTFLLDGGLNNDLLDNGVVYNPNPDAVEEFRVLTSNFGAEYGRNAGGIITVVTKSGTNDFHGSGFEFNRNTIFNANDFFSNSLQQPRAVLQRNQYGGTLGGPIRKDKLFFFAAYERTRQNQLLPSGVIPVFTPQELQGDFSASPNRGLVANFLQEDPFFQPDPALAAQGIIDPNTFDPVAKKYISAGLAPAFAQGRMSFQNPAITAPQEVTAKLDWEITNKDRISATLGHSQDDQLVPGPGGIPGFSSKAKITRQFFNLNHVRVVSANMLNEFRLTAQRSDILQGVPATNLPKPNALGININSDNPTGPTRIDLPGLLIGFTLDGPFTQVDNTFSYSDTFSWIHGKHTTKFGGTFSAFQDNQIFDFVVNGDFTFTNTDGEGNPLGAGDSFANFLLGIPNNFLQFPVAPSNIRTKATYIFGQDEWHLAPNLVLTYGLRYEYSTPKSDTQGRTFSIVPRARSTVFPGAPVGLLFPGDKGAPKGANFADRNDFAPRFGFAWQPFHDNSTSVRGGFGVFYDVLKGEDNLQFNGQQPFASSAFIEFPGAAGGPFGFLTDPFGSTGTINPFPSKPVDHRVDFASTFGTFGGAGVFFVDPHLRTPYVYQYNLSIEQELFQSTMLEIAYVGSASRKLTALKDVNPFDPATLASGNPVRILNETPGNIPDNVSAGIPGSFGFLPEFTNSANSNYNALQIALRKQPGPTPFIGPTGFTLAYTYAHNIDDASGFLNNSIGVPFFTPRIFRASSDFDLRHVLTFSGSWDLPLDRGPKRLVKGWSLYPIISYRTGFPFTVGSGQQITDLSPGQSGAGDASLTKADLISPIQYFNPHGSRSFGGTTGFFYFNPGSFSATPSPPYGTAPRNGFRGPGRINIDMSLAKATSLYNDHMNLELRIDAFNLLNHTQFRSIDTGIFNSTFGQVISTYAPRELQLAAHLRF